MAARQAALKMLGDLRNAFGELIDEAEWMDQGSEVLDIIRMKLFKF